MKEIALLGTTNHVFGDVLGSLLAKGLSVNALVDNPEKVMPRRRTSNRSASARGGQRTRAGNARRLS